MIKPALAMPMWFWFPPVKEPFAAIVSYVHDDGRLNLVVFGGYGAPWGSGAQNVPFVAEGEKPPEEGGYCVLPDWVAWKGSV